MSSMDIAALTDKNHADVLRDIRNTFEQAEIVASKFAGYYTASNGKQNPCYYLPKFELDLVVSGYSVKYRAAIIKRWHELEAEKTAAAPQFEIPATMAEALRLAADTMDQLDAAKAELEAAAPKLLTYSRVMSSNDLFGFRETAAILAQKGIGSTNLVIELENLGILYHEKRGEKKGRVFAKAQYIHAGYFRMIERAYEVREKGGAGTSEWRVSATLKVTPAGVEWIAKRMAERRAAAV